MNPKLKNNQFFQAITSAVYCLFLSSVNAQTKPYAVPPNILEQRVELGGKRTNRETLADFQLNTAKMERLIGGALSTSSEKITE